MKRPLYRHIASRLDAMQNCRETGNAEWLGRHGDVLNKMCRDYLPRGSGIDNGTTFVEHMSSPERLVFDTGFHHMNDAGYYDGWTDHRVIVTASLLHGIDIRITGRDRNDIKDYLHEVFHAALTDEIDDASIVTPMETDNVQVN